MMCFNVGAGNSQSRDNLDGGTGQSDADRYMFY